MDNTITVQLTEGRWYASDGDHGIRIFPLLERVKARHPGARVLIHVLDLPHASRECDADQITRTATAIGAVC